MMWLWIAVAGLLVAAVAYWLLVITEGVFLGKRLVVWLYDVTAFRYDRVKEWDDEDEEILVVQPVLALTRQAQPTILDVATGTGRVPLFLLRDERFDGTIVALDPSAKMLGYAKSAVGQLSLEQQQRVVLGEHSAENLPFPDANFDGITCLEALEFMPSDKAALHEMVRVLRPGGFLMVTRRKEWEAYTFLHRYRSRAGMIQLVESLGVERVQCLDWQSNYDLVVGRKSASSGSTQRKESVNRPKKSTG